MITSLDFCRVCLLPSENTKLTSLLDENGKNMEKFEAVSGINVRDNEILDVFLFQWFES